MGVGGGGSPEQPVKTSAHKSWARAPEPGSAVPRNWRPRRTQQSLNKGPPSAGPTRGTPAGPEVDGLPILPPTAKPSQGRQ